ncbi:hypothetical protein [Undibacterium sp. SXout20W]|uniref:hypothetical protein n=1 Tax=Undibacterium sp. SXout20W TaxID=3413051 RepID=UPI003BF28688
MNVMPCWAYFSHPHCSWERSPNENTNGLIHQFFHKKKRFEAISEGDNLRAIKAQIIAPKKASVLKRRTKYL